MKKSILIIGTALLIVGMIGCTPAAPAPKTDKVAYLINGALGDKAFYDSGQLGIDQLAKEYGVETRTFEAKFDPAEYGPSLQDSVNFADVIFVVSYGFEDQLREYADKNPGKIFVNLDTVVENSKRTITSVDFVEEESAYLTGIVAGLTTLDTSIPGINPEKIIGAVGGDVDPVVSAFVFAYTNGARSVDPQMKVETKFLGSWDDAAKGKQAALQLYDLKADVIFQIAGAAGMGVLQAAGERGLYAIGVDTNQNDLVPGNVVASDIKNVGKAVEDVFKTIKDGGYQPGTVLKYGLASGGVDIDFTARKQALPQSIRDNVMAVRQQIMDGTLKVELYQGE